MPMAKSATSSQQSSEELLRLIDALYGYLGITYKVVKGKVIITGKTYTHS